MKNNKPILVVLVVFVLLLLVFGTWKLAGARRAAPKAAQPQQQQSKSDESSITGSVFDLMKLGKTLKCTYDMNTEGAALSGTSYISGNRMRGDFESTDPTGNKIQSHMISDGEWVYTWTSAAPQGFKMKVSDADSEATTPSESTPAESQKLDALKNDLDYKCAVWVEDTSLLQVPSDVEFVDFSESLKKINTGSGNSMCAACDYAQSDEDKSACKKQLGCN